MPRVSAAQPTLEAGPPPPRAGRPRPARKPTPPQDRLTQRALFLRRVKRSLKPGLWFLAIATVLGLGAEFVRSLPASAPAGDTAPVAAAPVAPVPESSGFVAGLLADLGLRISAVKVNGAETTDPALLQQTIGVKPGDPAMGFSLDEVRARVEQLGPVQAVTVERVLPGTLIVNVTERNAFAIWQTTVNGKTGFVLIDKQGNVIADQDAAAAKRRQPSLLLLTGADAPANADALIEELQAAPAVGSHVAAAERVDGLRWNLILKNQTVVKLPAQGEADAIGQLAALQQSMQLLDRPVEAIDLRQSGRLVVRPYPAPAPPSPAAKPKLPKEEGQ